MHSIRTTKKSEIPELNLSAETISLIEHEFTRYNSYKKIVEDLSKRLGGTTVEDWINIRSSADIELDVRVDSSISPYGQTERDTIRFTDQQEKLLKAKAKAEALERALDNALEMAKRTANPCCWAKVADALYDNLVLGVPKSKIRKISYRTLNKYRNIAIACAARNLGLA